MKKSQIHVFGIIGVTPPPPKVGPCGTHLAIGCPAGAQPQLESDDVVMRHRWWGGGCTGLFDRYRSPVLRDPLAKIYALEKDIYQSNDKELIDAWKKMLTSDHYYYMTTKFWADGDVHKYFSPYESPYDAYIYFMNAMSDLSNQLKKKAQPRLKKK